MSDFSTQLTNGLMEATSLYVEISGVDLFEDLKVSK